MAEKEKNPPGWYEFACKSSKQFSASKVEYFSEPFDNNEIKWQLESWADSVASHCEYIEYSWKPYTVTKEFLDEEIKKANKRIRIEQKHKQFLIAEKAS